MSMLQADQEFAARARTQTVSTRIVDSATDAVGYVGSLALLGCAALIAPLRRRHGSPSIISEASRELEALLVLGFPILALIHAAFGSIFAMQAFFRATFAETNGAVVGVAMLRSVAPLITGVTVAVLLAIRCAAGMPRTPLSEDQGEDTAEIGRGALARILAAMFASPVLALWGAAVGTVVGALVSKNVLGIASGTYFGFFFEMLQASDVVGVLVLSSAYAGTSAAIACHECCRAAPLPERGALVAAYRSVVFSTLAILLINGAWFGFVHVAGGTSALSIVGKSLR